MENINEELLTAWLKISTSINNSRLVSKMSFNESLICNILYNNQISDSPKNLTATDLCKETQILKSQMNRTLNKLDERGMITRIRSEQDKRHVFIQLNTENSANYITQHKEILSIIDSIIDKIGIENAKTAIISLKLLSDAATNILD